MSNTPTPFTLTKGDTGYTFGSLLCSPNGDPIDLTGLTIKFAMYNGDTALLAESTTGVTIHPTFAFTCAATGNVLTCNGHRLVNGQQIQVSNSGGALPTGLTAGVRYFVVEASPNRLKVAITPTGAPVSITSAGTGTHSLWAIGSVQYAWQAATPINAPGDYPVQWTVYDGTAKRTFPNDQDENDPKLIIRVKDGLL